VDVSDLLHAAANIRLQLLAQPILSRGCAWSDLREGCLANPLGPAAQTLARWQAAWCLSQLLRRWEGLVVLLGKLLACVLLEQKVLLLGEWPCISTVALLLRSLLWPFRWLHLFLSAPPPPEILKVPFLEATFPMVLAIGDLPPHWGYDKVQKLPPEVVAAVLNNQLVHISPLLKTAGGLKGNDIKLPGRMHADFRTQVTAARIELRNSKIGVPEAVEKVQLAA
ncbi:unnamed protein product, partial [Polarella glacialis]